MNYSTLPLVALAVFFLAPDLRAQEAAPAKNAPAKKLTILAVGAHMDDAEIGMGGSSGSLERLERASNPAIFADLMVNGRLRRCTEPGTP